MVLVLACVHLAILICSTRCQQKGCQLQTLHTHWRSQTLAGLAVPGLSVTSRCRPTQAASVTGGTSVIEAKVTAALDTDMIAAASSAQAVQGRPLLCG